LILQIGIFSNLKGKEQVRYDIVVGNKYFLTEDALQNDYLNIGTPEMQVWRIMSQFPEGKLLNVIQVRRFMIRNSQSCRKIM
jgi:hypothetical protein